MTRKNIKKVIRELIICKSMFSAKTKNRPNVIDLDMARFPKILDATMSTPKEMRGEKSKAPKRKGSRRKRFKYGSHRDESICAKRL